MGGVPVGEYVFNPLAENTTIQGQTLFEWFIAEYLFGERGAGANNGTLISGFFFDDQLNSNGPTEMDGRAFEDMGVSPAQGAALSAAYYAFMGRAYAALLARGAFSWQQLWTAPGGGFTPAKIGTTCPEPLIGKNSCAQDLRLMCNASAPPFTRAIHYAFSPGRCKTNPANLTYPLQDIAGFLLVRGDYAWLGHGWEGCGRTFSYPPELHQDYGVPLGVCAEVAPNVWQREWTGATISLDCGSWSANITMK